MNDLYFTTKNKKGLQIKSLSQKVYIIRHEVAVYHQCKALYIIITEFSCTLKRDDMQKRAKKSLFLMIYTQTSCVMIYHYSVMDKKMTVILYQNYSLFLVRVTGLEHLHKRLQCFANNLTSSALWQISRKFAVRFFITYCPYQERGRAFAPPLSWYG